MPFTLRSLTEGSGTSKIPIKEVFRTLSLSDRATREPEGLSLDKITSEPAPLQADSPGASISGDNAHLTDEKKQTLIDQVRQLSSDTHSIDVSFSNISIRLQQLAQSKLPPDAHIAITQLSDQWKRHYERYNQLIWKSRDMAGDARVIAQDFANVLIDTILLQPSVSLQEKKEAIGDYVKFLAKDKESTRDLVNGFNLLAVDVTTFCEEWEDVIVRHRLLRFSFRSKEHEEKISTLNRSLKKAKIKVVSMSIILGFLVAAAGAGAVAVLCAMHGTPGISVGTLAGIPVRFVLKHLKTALSEKKDLAQQLRDMTSDREDSEKDLADIRNIASKLGGIASIWGCIQADLKFIEGLVERALNTPNYESMRLALESRLSLVRSSYMDMAEIFREYQVAIGGSGNIVVTKS
ncbi:hypothetical protein QCA50_013585 [Cerrena zonata]|uniref:Uncharacterized protein n=1 Tax=Cerrena zonata TaxID=2478898 RepID=A0AAW0FQI4_9APHY